MTTSNLAAPPDLLGAQRPRVSCVPPYVSSTGQEAIELCAMAGLHLDPWEAFVLSESLGEREDGRWAAFEVALDVSRQNGKGAVLEAREITGLYLLGEPLIIHSAHQFDTSLEHFRRLLELIEGCDDLCRRVKRISRSHGEEGIELYGERGKRRTGGQRIRFRTRTKGGGRGFTGDLLVLDEAMDIPESFHGALLPTLSARSITGNPQVWYAGSAVDKWVHDNGIVFARVRERGHAGDDPSLAYFEWSLDAEDPDAVDEALATDPESWAQANPGLGIRISAEHIGREHRSMDGRTFAVERLGVGDWPKTDGADELISLETWDGCVDVRSQARDPVCFTFDVSPDRSWASIAVSGLRADKRSHVEIVERKRGTGWIAERLAELVGRHETSLVLCDGAGPASSLLAPLRQLEVDVTPVTAQEYTQACGVFVDAAAQDTLRHLGTEELRAAVKGAAQRSLGDSWAWSRKNSGVDITPLVASTLALWGGLQERKQSNWRPL